MRTAVWASDWLGGNTLAVQASSQRELFASGPRGRGIAEWLLDTKDSMALENDITALALLVLKSP